jgi:3-methyladenine DNA glycosylase AlkD
MNKAQVIHLLEQNKNQLGIDHWNRLNYSTRVSYGIGLTKLKKLAKQIGKDHELALELWDSYNYDVQTMGILVDDPKKVTRNQVDQQVKHLDFWLLSHTYCTELMPKVKFLKELMEEWIYSENDLKRRCGYLMLSELAKSRKKIPNEYFLPHIHTIRDWLQTEENFVKDAMNNALSSIGKRSQFLNSKCISAARKIGKVKVDYGDSSCEAIDVIKHLTSDPVREKFV